VTEPKQRNVVADAIFLIVVALLVLGMVLLWSQRRQRPPGTRLNGTVLWGQQFGEPIVLGLQGFYELHGEYPADILQIKDSVPKPGLVNHDAIPITYYTATDEKGRRFACLVLWPGFDRKYQVKGECFTRRNVGLQPQHWRPARCTARMPEGGADKWYQLIQNRYYVSPGGREVFAWTDTAREELRRFVYVSEIRDLSNPPPVPDYEPPSYEEYPQFGEYRKEIWPQHNPEPEAMRRALSWIEEHLDDYEGTEVQFLLNLDRYQLQRALQRQGQPAETGAEGAP